MQKQTECLYCGEVKNKNRDKSKSDFNTEHVIPQAFGKFGPETPTLDIVCKKCNQLFGDEIDAKLARAYLERFYYGQKSNFDPNKHFKNQTAKVVGGLLDGLNVIPSERNPQLIIPAHNVDFGLRRTEGTYEWFTFNSLPTLEEFKQYPVHSELVLLWNIDKKAKLIQLFQEKYELSLEFTQEVNEGRPLIPNEVDVGYESLFNEHMLRAIYKIGFNFFAHYCTNNNLAHLPYDKCFGPIKKYILAGEKPSWFEYPPRDTMNKPVLANEDPAKAILLHIVTFEATPNGCLTSSVALYNKAHIRLLLACKDYPGAEFRYAKGFCPFTKKIIEIDANGIFD